MRANFTIIFLFILILSSEASFAQKGFEITPFGGYVFAEKFNTAFGYAQASDAALYGLDLALPVRRNVAIELSYERQDSHIFSYSINSQNPDYFKQKIPVSVNYFLVGGVYGKKLANSPFRPYIGLSIGAVLADGKKQEMMNWSSEWLFDFRAKIGVKIFPSDGVVGIRLQAQLNAPLEGAGAGINCGIGPVGSGCGISVNTFTTLTQFGFTGGIIFRLGEGNGYSKQVYTH